MTPFQFFDQIEFPDDFSEEGIRRCIDENIHRVYHGGMSRSDFELAVFQMDIDAWPLGHLQDHRVSLPKSIAQKLSASADSELVHILGRLLCAVDIGGAPTFIAEALGLNPKLDAKELLEINAQSSDAFIALLTGQLDKVRSTAKNTNVSRPQLNAATRIMLLYYGALELQLIAARSRAMNNFGFGVRSGPSGPTFGGIMRDWEGVMNAIEYSATTVENDKKPRGALSSLFKQLEAKAEQIKQSYGMSYNEILAALSDVLNGILMPIVADHARPQIAKWRTMGESGKQPKDSRMEISTAIAGKTSGEQIAFASLRLESLIDNTDVFLGRKKPTQEALDKFNSIDFRSGANGPSLRLYYAYQAIVLNDFRTSWHGSLVLSFANYALSEAGNQSSTTIKNVRSESLLQKSEREAVDVNLETPLVGPQCWDILPDYRFRIKHTLPTGTRKPDNPRQRHALPEHIRKHGQTRMAHKQVRHYKASINS
ncbi:MAG: hypothetical protein ABGW87_06900 [Sphingomonadaceae bacterium]